MTSFDFAAWESAALVVDRGKVSLAARERGYSPAAVSRHLSRLQRRLGVRLFERDGRSLRPTEDLLALLVRVRPVLEDVAALQRELKPVAAGAAAGREKASESA